MRDGNPITAVPSLVQFAQWAGAPPHHIPTSHLSDNSLWQIAEAVGWKVREELRQALAKAAFVSISLDEATAIGNMAVLCCHIYVLRNWTRVPIFLELKQVSSMLQAACSEVARSCVP